jgi:hypothetical protein
MVAARGSHLISARSPKKSPRPNVFTRDFRIARLLDHDTDGISRDQKEAFASIALPDDLLTMSISTHLHVFGDVCNVGP